MIDVHSHLLPGIDDGCRSVEESLSCVRILLDHGFRGTICTPHIWSAVYPENTPGKIAEYVAVLEEQLLAAGLRYQLWAGGEVRIADDTPSWLEKHGVPTIGPSRNVLVDYWGTDWPAFADLVIEQLVKEGYQPILAHPERMDIEEQEWDAVLSSLQQRGVWLQGNLKCLAGREGSRPGQRSQRLLREDRYRVLATDMHGTLDLGDRLTGLRAVEQQVGATKLRELLVDGPRELLVPDSK